MMIVIILFLTTLNFGQEATFTSIGMDNSDNSVESIPLIKLLEDLAKREGLQLAYESELLEDKYYFSPIDDLSLEETLDKVLSFVGLEYEIIGDLKVLIRAKHNAPSNFQSLYGQISDRKTEEKLSYVSISLLGTNLGCYADSLGQFKLTIPSNYNSSNDTLIVSRIGYVEKRIPLAQFINNDIISLDVNKRLLPFVVIVPSLDPIIIDEIKLGTTIENDIRGWNRLGNKDVFRKLQMLPSVAANSAGSSEIKIRGSKSFETLILLDGLPIYNPSHYYNVFSSINNDYISNINFYKNGIPADIRSMTGGVVEMGSKSKDFMNFSGNIELNLLELSGTINIPVSNKLAASISLRKSIFDQTRNSFLKNIITPNDSNNDSPNLSDLIRKRSQPNFNYYDFNGSVQWKLNVNNEIVFNIYKSTDEFKDNYSRIGQFGGAFVKKHKVSIDYKDFSNWENTGVGMTYSHQWNSKALTEVSLYLTKFDESSELDINIKRTKENEVINHHIFDKERNSINDYGLKLKNSMQLNTTNSFYYGFDLINYKIDSEVQVRDVSIFSNKNQYSAITPFIEYKYSKNNFQVISSMRTSYYTGTEKVYFDPNLTLSYDMGNYNIYGSINRQHQYLRSLEYENRQSKRISIWSLANKSLPILTSMNFSIGTNYRIGKSQFNIEAYAKLKQGITNLVPPKPVPNSGNNTPPLIGVDYKLFLGDGHIYGIDLMWTQNIGNYNSQLAYTYSVNEQRFKDLFNGFLHPSSDDSRHQIKWSQLYQCGRWGLGVDMIYSSGTPYFDFTSIDKDRDKKNIQFDNYIKFLPDYFRADLSVHYNFELFKNDAKMSFSVYNFTNRENVTSTQLLFTDRDQGSQQQLELLSSPSNLLNRTLNLGFHVAF